MKRLVRKNESQATFGWHHTMPPDPVAVVDYRHLIDGLGLLVAWLLDDQ
ncbi:MAG: hypothetical protein ACKOEO_14715 [Planctomycetaceae bacterium]